MLSTFDVFPVVPGSLVHMDRFFSMTLLRSVGSLQVRRLPLATLVACWEIRGDGKTVVRWATHIISRDKHRKATTFAQKKSCEWWDKGKTHTVNETVDFAKRIKERRD